MRPALFLASGLCGAGCPVDWPAGRGREPGGHKRGLAMSRVCLQGPWRPRAAQKEAPWTSL